MKKNRSNIIILFLIILSFFLTFISCVVESDWFHVIITLENYPNIENYFIDEIVMCVNSGDDLNYMGVFFHIKKINENKLYGSILEMDNANLFLSIEEGYMCQKMRESKGKIFFDVEYDYYTTATWNGNGSVTVTQDDIKFFDKTFWDYYILGKFDIRITNIDASLPFSPIFRLLLSDNNNADNTNIHILSCSDGQHYFYDYIKVGEGYEPSQFYIKIEEYNSVSEQYELTKISKEKIINMADNEIYEYNTIVDWNGGSPIITEDDFKLFDDTAWNIVE